MSRPRKLLFYTHALAGGGAERVMALLASGFAGRGDEVIFVCDHEAKQNAGYITDKVRVVTLDRGHFGATLELARMLRKEAPDVALSAISVSNLKLFIAAILSGRLSRCVQSVHGFFRSEPQLLSRIGYLLLPLSSRLMARTVTVSEGLELYLGRYWSSSGRNVHIANPVLTRGRPENPVPLARRAPLVLSAGRFVDYKNYPLLVRAFAKLRAKDARLVILGEGPERANIEAVVAEHGLQDRVSLPGYEPEPWKRYDEARVYVSPADSEAFGLVVVEALAAGLPIVATATAGPWEIVDDNPALGVITPIGDADAMATAIDHALANPGDPAPRYARADDFTVDKSLDAYSDMFDEVIEGRANSHPSPRFASA